MARQRMAEDESDGENRERHEEPGDGTCHSHVEQLAPIGEHRAETDERAHGSDERGNERHGDEVRR